jgi:hypothetical protein
VALEASSDDEEGKAREDMKDDQEGRGRKTECTSVQEASSKRASC